MGLGEQHAAAVRRTSRELTHQLQHCWGRQQGHHNGPLPQI